MATVTIKLPDEFMNQLSEFDSRLEDIFTKSLEAGAEIAEKQAKANLKAVIGSGTKFPSKAAGELLGALGTSPVKRSSLGGFDIRVGFAEPRKDGESNEMVANIIEYGKKGQAAKPFMKPAEDATKSKVKAKMEETFKAEAEKIFK